MWKVFLVRDATQALYDQFHFYIIFIFIFYLKKICLDKILVCTVCAQNSMLEKNRRVVTFYTPYLPCFHKVWVRVTI